MEHPAPARQCPGGDRYGVLLPCIPLLFLYCSSIGALLVLYWCIPLLVLMSGRESSRFSLTNLPFCAVMIDAETGVVRRWPKSYLETETGRARRRQIGRASCRE